MLPSHEEDKALKDGISFVLPEKDKNGRYVVFMRPGNNLLLKSKPINWILKNSKGRYLWKHCATLCL